ADTNLPLFSGVVASLGNLSASENFQRHRITLSPTSTRRKNFALLPSSSSSSSSCLRNREEEEIEEEALLKVLVARQKRWGISIPSPSSSSAITSSLLKEKTQQRFYTLQQQPLHFVVQAKDPQAQYLIQALPFLGSCFSSSFSSSSSSVKTLQQTNEVHREQEKSDSRGTAPNQKKSVLPPGDIKNTEDIRVDSTGRQGGQASSGRKLALKETISSSREGRIRRGVQTPEVDVRHQERGQTIGSSLATPDDRPSEKASSFSSLSVASPITKEIERERPDERERCNTEKRQTSSPAIIEARHTSSVEVQKAFLGLSISKDPPFSPSSCCPSLLHAFPSSVQMKEEKRFLENRTSLEQSGDALLDRKHQDERMKMIKKRDEERKSEETLKHKISLQPPSRRQEKEQEKESPGKTKEAESLSLDLSSPTHLSISSLERNLLSTTVTPESRSEIRKEEDEDEEEKTRVVQERGRVTPSEFQLQISKHQEELKYLREKLNRVKSFVAAGGEPVLHRLRGVDPTRLADGLRRRSLLREGENRERGEEEESRQFWGDEEKEKEEADGEKKRKKRSPCEEKDKEEREELDEGGQGGKDGEREMKSKEERREKGHRRREADDRKEEGEEEVQERRTERKDREKEERRRRGRRSEEKNKEEMKEREEEEERREEDKLKREKYSYEAVAWERTKDSQETKLHVKREKQRREEEEDYHRLLNRKVETPHLETVSERRMEDEREREMRETRLERKKNNEEEEELRDSHEEKRDKEEEEDSSKNRKGGDYEEEMVDIRYVERSRTNQRGRGKRRGEERRGSEEDEEEQEEHETREERRNSYHSRSNDRDKKTSQHETSRVSSCPPPREGVHTPHLEEKSRRRSVNLSNTSRHDGEKRPDFLSSPDQQEGTEMSKEEKREKKEEDKEQRFFITGGEKEEEEHKKSSEDFEKCKENVIGKPTEEKIETSSIDERESLRHRFTSWRMRKGRNFSAKEGRDEEEEEGGVGSSSSTVASVPLLVSERSREEEELRVVDRRREKEKDVKRKEEEGRSLLRNCRRREQVNDEEEVDNRTVAKGVREDKQRDREYEGGEESKTGEEGRTERRSTRRKEKESDVRKEETKEEEANEKDEKKKKEDTCSAEETARQEHFSLIKKKEVREEEEVSMKEKISRQHRSRSHSELDSYPFLLPPNRRTSLQERRRRRGSVPCDSYYENKAASSSSSLSSSSSPLTERRPSSPPGLSSLLGTAKEEKREDRSFLDGMEEGGKREPMTDSPFRAASLHNNDSSPFTSISGVQTAEGWKEPSRREQEREECKRERFKTHEKDSRYSQDNLQTGDSCEGDPRKGKKEEEEEERREGLGGGNEQRGKEERERLGKETEEDLHEHSFKQEMPRTDAKERKRSDRSVSSSPSSSPQRSSFSPSLLSSPRQGEGRQQVVSSCCTTSHESSRLARLQEEKRRERRERKGERRDQREEERRNEVAEKFWCQENRGLRHYERTSFSPEKDSCGSSPSSSSSSSASSSSSSSSSPPSVAALINRFEHLHRSRSRRAATALARDGRRRDLLLSHDEKANRRRRSRRSSHSSDQEISTDEPHRGRGERGEEERETEERNTKHERDVDKQRLSERRTRERGDREREEKTLPVSNGGEDKKQLKSRERFKTASSEETDSTDTQERGEERTSFLEIQKKKKECEKRRTEEKRKEKDNDTERSLSLSDDEEEEEEGQREGERDSQKAGEIACSYTRLDIGEGRENSLAREKTLEEGENNYRKSNECVKKKEFLRERGSTSGGEGGGECRLEKGSTQREEERKTRNCEVNAEERRRASDCPRIEEAVREAERKKKDRMEKAFFPANNERQANDMEDSLLMTREKEEEKKHRCLTREEDHQGREKRQIECLSHKQSDSEEEERDEQGDKQGEEVIRDIEKGKPEKVEDRRGGESSLERRDEENRTERSEGGKEGEGYKDEKEEEKEPCPPSKEMIGDDDKEGIERFLSSRGRRKTGEKPQQGGSKTMPPRRRRHSLQRCVESKSFKRAYRRLQHNEVDGQHEAISQYLKSFLSLKEDLCEAKEALLRHPHGHAKTRERFLHPACLLREHLKTVLLLTARLLLPAPLGKKDGLDHLSIKDHYLKELLHSTCFNQTSPLPEYLTLSPSTDPSSSSLRGGKKIFRDSERQESFAETTDAREDTHEKRRRSERRCQNEDRLLQQERSTETRSKSDAREASPPLSPCGLDDEREEKLKEGDAEKKAQDLLHLGEEGRREDNKTPIRLPLGSSSSEEEQSQREKDLKETEENGQERTRDPWVSEIRMKEKHQDRNVNSAGKDEYDEEEDQDALLSCLFDILQKAEKLCCQLKHEKRSSSFFTPSDQREEEDKREERQDTSYLPNPTNLLPALTFFPSTPFLPPSTEDRNEGSSPIKAASLPSSTPLPLFADIENYQGPSILPSRGSSVHKTRRLWSSSSPPSERQARWRGDEGASLHYLHARKRTSEDERGDLVSLMSFSNCGRRSSTKVPNSGMNEEHPVHIYADPSRMIGALGLKRVGDEQEEEEADEQGGEFEEKETHISTAFLSQTSRETPLLSSKNRLSTMHRRYSAPVNGTEEGCSSSPTFSFPRLRDFHLAVQTTHPSRNDAFPEFQLKRVEFLRRKLQQLAETVAREEEEKEKKTARQEKEKKNKDGLDEMSEGSGRIAKLMIGSSIDEREEEEEKEGQELLVRERGMQNAWMASNYHSQATLMTSPSPPPLSRHLDTMV
ncbi:hypothetical protein CSUI_001873, partial [Cystoisospora suis]